MQPSTLAERCKAQRKLLGLSQRAVGAACGLSDVAITLIETGVTKHPRNILRLATVLKCNPYWLLFGDTDEKDTSTDK